MLPNFLIVGAGKCGTTALNFYLDQHPEIYMSPVKEPSFFALEGDTFPGKEDDPDEKFNFPTAVTDRGEYEALFNGVQSEKAIGEVSPIYLYSERAPEAIQRAIPDVKIIVMMRDPVERLYSRYMHLARENRQPSDSFEDALGSNDIWWERNDLITEGFYAQHWMRYLDLFPAAQVKVILYEDFMSNPIGTAADIFRFLGVDATFEPNMGTKHNKSGFIKNRWMDRLVGQQSVLKQAVASVAPQVWGRIKQNRALKDLVERLRNKNIHKPKLEKALREKMIQQLYRDDIIALQSILGRDLNSWLTA